MPSAQQSRRRSDAAMRLTRAGRRAGACGGQAGRHRPALQHVPAWRRRSDVDGGKGGAGARRARLAWPAPRRRHAHAVDAVVVHALVLGVEEVAEVRAAVEAAHLAFGAEAQVSHCAAVLHAVPGAAVANRRLAVRAVERRRMEAGPGPLAGGELVELPRGVPKGRAAARAPEDALRVLEVRGLLPGHAAALLQLRQLATRYAHGLELRVADVLQGALLCAARYGRAPAAGAAAAPQRGRRLPGWAARGLDGLDLQVHLTLDALGPHGNRLQVLQGGGVRAVLLAVLARLDGLARGVVPVVGETRQRQGDGAEGAHLRSEIRLVSVCKGLASRCMRVAKGEPVATELAGRPHGEVDRRATGDVGEGLGVDGAGLDEAGRPQEGDVDDLAVEDPQASLDREGSRRLSPHHRIVLLLPRARCAVGAVERRQRNVTCLRRREASKPKELRHAQHTREARNLAPARHSWSGELEIRA
eukprot:CAMPEP_0175581854 /NCGR_PEP_ID=MMETSP0096-20121207/47836_1 /TAXON_ID=311494 /ORGANISM="Alexandrium monilatum, Strain CCMP3105" /LENGTH=472 /DNA_ID=CAMNT_0016885509 /DNA_START=204 /DNA_END=1622 /DNA_ORIENTATION=-